MGLRRRFVWDVGVVVGRWVALGVLVFVWGAVGGLVDIGIPSRGLVCLLVWSGSGGVGLLGLAQFP